MIKSSFCLLLSFLLLSYNILGQPIQGEPTDDPQIDFQPVNEAGIKVSKDQRDIEQVPSKQFISHCYYNSFTASCVDPFNLCSGPGKCCKQIAISTTGMPICGCTTQPLNVPCPKCRRLFPSTKCYDIQSQCYKTSLFDIKNCCRLRNGFGHYPMCQCRNCFQSPKCYFDKGKGRCVNQGECNEKQCCKIVNVPKTGLPQCACKSKVCQTDKCDYCSFNPIIQQCQNDFNVCRGQFNIISKKCCKKYQLPQTTICLCQTCQ